MPRTTIGLGAVLILLGLYAYFVLGGDDPSMTALIPAFIGAPIAVLGGLALRRSMRKHAMHAAAALGLLSVLATAPGLVKLVRSLVSDYELARPAAVGVQTTMCLLCLVFVVLCVRSFINARRAQASG